MTLGGGEAIERDNGAGTAQGAVETSGVDWYHARPDRQRRLTAVLTIVATMAVIDRTIMSLLFNPIRVDLHFSVTEMSLIFGIGFALSNVCFTLPAGFLADRISRRGMIAAGSFLWSLMTMASGTATGFSGLLIFRAGVGGAEAVVHPSAYSMLRAAIPANRLGRAYAVYGMSIMGGSALGFLLGGVLIAVVPHLGFGQFLAPMLGPEFAQPWRQVMVVLGLIGLPFSLAMLATNEPIRRARTHTDQGTVSEAFHHIATNWMFYLPIFAFSAFLSMQSSAYGALLASIPLRRWHLPVSEVGTRLGLIMLLVAPIGNWVVGVLMDILRHRFNVVGLAMVGGATMVLMTALTTLAPVASDPGMFYLLSGGVFMFGGAGFAITGASIAAFTPARSMGKVSALQFVVYGIVGMGGGPTIVGYATDHFFTGQAHALAVALSRCSLLFTSLALTSMLLLLLVCRKWTPPAMEPI